MKLIDLKPRFVSSGGEGSFRRDAKGDLIPLPERVGVGIIFQCPCGTCNTESFIPFKNPISGGPPVEVRRDTWQRTGEDFETLTLRPSILRKSGCGWHGYLTDGVFKSV